MWVSLYCSSLYKKVLSVHVSLQRFSRAHSFTSVCRGFEIHAAETCVTTTAQRHQIEDGFWCFKNKKVISKNTSELTYLLLVY